MSVSVEVGDSSELLDEEVAPMGFTDPEGCGNDDDTSELLGDCKFCAEIVVAVLVTGMVVTVIVVIQSHTYVAEALVDGDEIE